MLINHLQQCFTPSVLRQRRTKAKVQLPYGNNWGTGSPRASSEQALLSTKHLKKWKNVCKQLKTTNYTQTLKK